MQPDVKRERRAGWAALAGAAVLCGAAISWYSADDGLSDQVRAARAEHDKHSGPELMADHVAKQEQANQALVTNIEGLKKGAGFVVSPYFTLKDTDITEGTQPGTVFKDRFARVHDEFADVAHNRGLGHDNYDEYLGFSKDKEVPAGTEVQFLLTMLQLTRRASRIALGTPTPVKQFIIKHDSKPRATGPANRPLMREYGLTMEITASIRDVLWILHRLSIAEKDAADTLDPGGYPLVLQGLTITSSVTSEVVNPDQVIQVVHATFHIAGMQFIPEDQRLARGATPTRIPAAGGGRRLGPALDAASAPPAASSSSGSGARP